MTMTQKWPSNFTSKVPFPWRFRNRKCCNCVHWFQKLLGNHLMGTEFSVCDMVTISVCTLHFGLWSRNWRSHDAHHGASQLNKHRVKRVTSWITRRVKTGPVVNRCRPRLDAEQFSGVCILDAGASIRGNAVVNRWNTRKKYQNLSRSQMKKLSNQSRGVGESPDKRNRFRAISPIIPMTPVYIMSNPYFPIFRTWSTYHYVNVHIVWFWI